MERSRCGRVCYGVPSCVWACLFLCVLSSCWKRMKLCIHYTQQGMSLQKCQPSLLHACLCKLMGSIFSPRWAGFDNQLFILSILLDERSFTNTFFSNVTKDPGDCCCPKTLARHRLGNRAPQKSCDKVTPGRGTPEFTTFPYLFAAGMGV